MMSDGVEVHYVVDVRVLMVTRVVETKAYGNSSRPSGYEKHEKGRHVTEVAHVVVSDKVMQVLLEKTAKHLALVDSDCDIKTDKSTLRG